MDRLERLLFQGHILPHDAAEGVVLWLFDRQGALVATLRHTGDAEGVTIPLLALARTLATTSAVHVFMAHNHPSGDPRPSAADVQATRQVWRLARTLGASLQDHWVIGGDRLFSFRAHGLL